MGEETGNARPSNAEIQRLLDGVVSGTAVEENEEEINAHLRQVAMNYLGLFKYEGYVGSLSMPFMAIRPLQRVNLVGEMYPKRKGTY